MLYRYEYPVQLVIEHGNVSANSHAPSKHYFGDLQLIYIKTLSFCHYALIPTRHPVDLVQQGDGGQWTERLFPIKNFFKHVIDAEYLLETHLWHIHLHNWGSTTPFSVLSCQELY